MEDRIKRAFAYTMVVLFIMVMLIPVIPSSFGIVSWLVTLVIATVVVPLVVLLSLRHAHKRTELADPELMTWKGYSAEEWAEREDPDDFGDEID